MASTAILLLLAAGFLYWVLDRNLDARDHALLMSKVQVLRLLLREQPGKTELLANEVEHEASESPLSYYLRILDSGGRVLMETPGMKEILPVSVFPAPATLPAELPPRMSQMGHHYGSFILLSVRAPLGTGGGQKRILQTALDISADTALLADYRRKLLAVLVSGLIFTAVVGGWVTRKGMQPLVEITRTAHHITASQLHERIAVSRWPAELTELASAFNAMLDRLEDSFTRLSLYSAELAHELRTPITNLRGEAEISLARVRSSEEYQQVLASSLEEYERLTRMIDGLLFVARADHPDTAIERTCFNARQEIEAVRDFYEALAGERAVEVTCEGEAWITGDPLLCRRAVSNLLANALNYTPSQGKVRISLQAVQDAIEIAVQDTGMGIAREHLPRVFDRFYRANPSRSKFQGGSGLGLAIVQSIMRLHGGAARLQSHPGQGTTVTLRFPS